MIHTRKVSGIHFVREDGEKMERSWENSQTLMQFCLSEGDRRERRKGGKLDVRVYSVIHTYKGTFGKALGLGAGGGEGPQASGRNPSSPRDRPHLVSQLCPVIGRSSLWEMWPQHKLGDEFQSLASGVLRQ